MRRKLGVSVKTADKLYGSCTYRLRRRGVIRIKASRRRIRHVYVKKCAYSCFQILECQNSYLLIKKRGRVISPSASVIKWGRRTK